MMLQSHVLLAAALVCTDDAMQCPDGSWVVRDADCNFPACPTSDIASDEDSESYSDSDDDESYYYSDSYFSEESTGLVEAFQGLAEDIAAAADESYYYSDSYFYDEDDEDEEEDDEQSFAAFQGGADADDDSYFEDDDSYYYSDEALAFGAESAAQFALPAGLALALAL